jgi:hypothetical protein
MNKKIIINVVIAIAVLSIAYTIFQLYIYRDLFGRTRDDKDEEEADDDNNEIVTDSIEGGFGCGGSFNTVVSINYDNPEANLNGCGIDVLNFQMQLNTEYGQNLAEDGKYGANTRQAHQNVLETMNGAWDGTYTTYASDTNPDAVFYG